MSTITELKDVVDTKTLNLVLLTVATGGIYPILWMYKNCSILESVTKKKISDSVFIIWVAVCVGLGSALAGTGDEVLEAIAGLFTIGSWVLYIVWAFRAKTALQEYALNEHKIDLRMNAFYTFLFTVYYINYCINDLPEAKRKQDVLSGHASTVES
ncbi:MULTISPECIES: DUF4234 domain-containing protein [Vibrio]|nr:MULTISPECIES: DUF4234 domain-containing protein [Vibrio]MBF4258445.1 DUF4234 domain-containing protein [Vibrio anguillarum]MBF4279476.1 DUF4234 domain-containing protein [Vibrio anguillarum]MBF4300603.1 DUF4234 domain-containing protein [Vibrio anguillarum]MBF4337059.1 DUF4234 domain-containing protein [Vibrio anguillarum]MBF4364620.1 DUF4234 domain-containing protein [Vibrio anguillarum]